MAYSIKTIQLSTDVLKYVTRLSKSWIQSRQGVLSTCWNLTSIEMNNTYGSVTSSLAPALTSSILEFSSDFSIVPVLLSESSSS